MKHGDKYHRGTGDFVKVMACVDGYVMYRFPRCYPVLLPVKAFLAEFVEAPQNTKERRKTVKASTPVQQTEKRPVNVGYYNY